MRGRRIIDVIGQRFGRRVVFAFHPERYRGREAMWHVRCDCGAKDVVSGTKLRSGEANSCGCAARDALIKRNTKHGMTGTRAYRIWKQIKNRCFNPRADNYRYYGARGIGMHENWREDFSAFHACMGDPPIGQSIDRINPNGNYEPGNCRWATPLVQVHNRRQAWWRYPKRRRSKRSPAQAAE